LKKLQSSVCEVGGSYEGNEENSMF